MGFQRHGFQQPNFGQLNYQQLLNRITPEVYEKLKRAVELGKWPNGRKLTRTQRETSLQAVIAYENKHLPPERRSGYIPPKAHSHCGGPSEVTEAEQPLSWQF